MNDSICTLAVYVTDRLTMPDTVKMAGHLAQAFGVPLTGLHVMASADAAVMAGGGIVTSGLIKSLREQARRQAETARETFELVTENHGWDGIWLNIEDTGLPFGERLAHVLHLNDLIVVGQDDPEEEAASNVSLINDIIMNSGGPVILHPHGWKQGEGGPEHAAIAWKNNREAARAVHDALPILSHVKSVTVLSAVPSDDDDNADPCRELCDHLAAHGIEATSHPIYGVDDREAGSALLDHAETLGADLIVLGAYGHSRLREGVFGGVTRTVVERTNIPAFLSH